MARDHYEADGDERKRQDLKNAPDDCDARALIRSFVMDDQSEERTRKQPAEMRGVIYEAATDVTDEEIEQDDRQQSRPESAFETFRQFMPELDAENEEHADQTEERARCARRRPIFRSEQEASDRADSQLRPHTQITRHDTCHTRHHPQHDELGRAVEPLDIRANHPQAVHVDEQVSQADVNENGRDEAPPFVLTFYQRVELCAVSDEDRLRRLPQSRAVQSARRPHQHEDEDIGDEKDDGEDVRATQDGAGEAHRLMVVNLRRCLRLHRNG